VVDERATLCWSPGKSTKDVHILKRRDMSLFIKQLLVSFRGQGGRGGQSAGDGSIWIMEQWRNFTF